MSVFVSVIDGFHIDTLGKCYQEKGELGIGYWASGIGFKYFPIPYSLLPTPLLYPLINTLCFYTISNESSRRKYLS